MTGFIKTTINQQHTPEIRLIFSADDSPFFRPDTKMLSFTTSPEKPYFGGEQARRLRLLAAHPSGSATRQQEAPVKCHTIAISGGKGGVGRSVIALNLAIVLSERGGRVGLLDASQDLGNIELLCGLNGYWRLSHVIEGCRRLEDILTDGPAGVTVISGGASLVDKDSDRSQNRSGIFSQLSTLENKLDWLIVDASGGGCESSREFARAADDTLIVTTPEPTAVAEAYAFVKSMASIRSVRLGLLVNQAGSEQQAQRILDRLQQASHSFLQVDLHRRGSIPRDEAVPASVNERVPFAMHSPDCAARAALVRLAQRLIRPEVPNRVAGYFSRLLNDGA